ncbi:MAG: hypothetical protein ACYCT9_03060 [Leptospirillum sp.]
MNDNISNLIRVKLADYIQGNISLRAFEDWIVPNSWNMSHLPSDAQDLSSDIELLLAEFSNGDWTEDEIKNLMEPLLRSVHIVTPKAQKPFHAESISQTFRVSLKNQRKAS